MTSLSDVAHVTYGLHSGDYKIRYVGKTSRNLGQRLSEHKSLARREMQSHLYNWMRAQGLENIKLEVLSTAKTEAELNRHETQWIASLIDLTNGTAGGEGALGRVQTDETRRKISETKRNRPPTAAQLKARKNHHRSWAGRKHTPETIEKMSEARKSYWKAKR